MTEQPENELTLPGPHAGDWEELALDYLTGSLEGPALRAVESHLSACEACRAALQEQQRLLEVLARSTAMATPPADLEGRVFAALDRGVSTEAGPNFWRRLADGLRRTRGPVWLPAAAALILVAVALTQADGLFSADSDESVSSTAAVALEAQPGSAGDERELAEDSQAPAEGGSSDTTTAGGAGSESTQAGPAPGSDTPAGESATESLPVEVWRVQRAPTASWPAGLTAARLASVTALPPQRDVPATAQLMLVARVSTADVSQVEARLNERGFMIDQSAAAGDDTGGPEAERAAVELAREAAGQAPLLQVAEDGTFQLSQPGRADGSQPGEGYLLLVFIVPA